MLQDSFSMMDLVRQNLHAFSGIIFFIKAAGRECICGADDIHRCAVAAYFFCGAAGMSVSESVDETGMSGDTYFMGECGGGSTADWHICAGRIWSHRYGWRNHAACRGDLFFIPPTDSRCIFTPFFLGNGGNGCDRRDSWHCAGISARKLLVRPWMCDMCLQHAGFIGIGGTAYAA